MKKLAIPIILLFVAACASTTQPQRSAIDEAKLRYADASLLYEATMLSLQDARRAHLVNDAQWTRIDKAQVQVRTYAPLVRQALNSWEQTGSKPESYIDAFAKLMAAFAEVQAVKGEVHP